ncbi:tyrosine-type recombinase/integrase [Brevundimonas sp. TWP2-3-2]|uniref:tyrosine-type recombinase/integrase n=1 Tax=Brevundimonas sp. TWP2-3-2 TaxID=2804648 RepID=UPI003CEB776A
MTWKTRLTVAVVKATLAGARDILVWDSELTGLHLKVTPTGKKSFYFYYRTADQRERRPKLGDFPALKPEVARTLAYKMKSEILHGRDPSGNRKAERADAATVATLLARYLSDHAEPHKKASSTKEDRRLINKMINPAIGSVRLKAVAGADIAALINALRETPVLANRVLALLSKAFSLAESWGLRPQSSNPAKGIQRYREKPRGYFLDDAETARLWNVLDDEDQAGTTGRSITAAIRLLLLTGRRKEEVLSLEWSFVDFDRGILNLPDTKTGRITVPLPGAAAEILLALKSDPEADPRWVIRGQIPGKHLVGIQKAWERLRSKAGLEAVRLHDLRHSYGGQAMALGLSLPQLGALLAHKSPTTTQRYAHFANDHRNASAELVDQRLAQITGRTS